MPTTTHILREEVTTALHFASMFRPLRALYIYASEDAPLRAALERQLSVLRRAGLLEWKGPKVRIPNLKGLCELAEFDPTYLSLMKEPR